MIRLTVNKHYGLATPPNISISIMEKSSDPLTSSLALITAPVTPELVDALRTAAKQASEALETFEARMQEAV